MTNKPIPILAPISSLPFGIYPPSSYPPPSFFESSSLLHPALIVPARRTGEIQTLLRDLILRQPKRKSVHPVQEGVDYSVEDVAADYDPTNERKLVLAGDDSAFREARIASLLDRAAPSTTAPRGKSGIRKSHVRLPASPYALLTVDRVLRRLLPATSAADVDAAATTDEVPSGFETAGHIGHVNLRRESLPYKYFIGRCVLDKNPKLRVVVNKIGTIENRFRTFPMEILAGEGLDVDALERLLLRGGAKDAAASEQFTIDPDAESGMQIQLRIGKHHRSLMEVQLKEHGCTFRLDFAHVYWNSRLQGEHGRLVRSIVNHAQSRGDAEPCVVADAMAGVGPFAVPLTSANASHRDAVPIFCHANDLNPVSYAYLQKNAESNRCHPDRLKIYNSDAREFIRKMNDVEPAVDHFIMNLPQNGPEFLNAFRGWTFRDDGDDDAASVRRRRRPVIHVYCFDEKARTPHDNLRIETNVLRRCETAMGCPGCLVDSKSTEEDDEIEMRVIRDVGPRKNMLCVSFRLPREVEGVPRISLAESSSDGLPTERADGTAAHKRTRDGVIDEGSSTSKRSKEAEN